MRGHSNIPCYEITPDFKLQTKLRLTRIAGPERDFETIKTRRRKRVIYLTKHQFVFALSLRSKARAFRLARANAKLINSPSF